MKRITMKLSNSAKKDNSRLYFRLKDGKNIDLFYRSNIALSRDQMGYFDREGNLRSDIKGYDRNIVERVEEEIAIIHTAYCSVRRRYLEINSSNLSMEISRIRETISEAPIEMKRKDILSIFINFIEDSYKDSIIGVSRYKHYKSLYTKLERFFKIKGISNMNPEDFSENDLMEFRDFLANEYKYVKTNPKVYAKLKQTAIPTKPKGINALVSDMKMLQTFFNDLVNRSLIERNPYTKLGRERKKVVMKTLYDAPFYLRSSEFFKVKDAEISDSLENARDAFVLQCMLGCRISDFRNLTTDNLDVSEEGIPYLRYLPQKTRKSISGNIEVMTPLLPSALEIIRKTGFKFPSIRKVYGSGGYNELIRTLLRQCGIDRKVAVFDKERDENKYVPICDIAGSKLCRKTFVDMMAKVQINIYAAGLHREGSSAVNRYTALELRDRYILMCTAFDEQPTSI